MLDFWFTEREKKNPKETQFCNLAQTLISLNNSHPLSTGTLMHQQVSWFLVQPASSRPVIKARASRCIERRNQRRVDAHQNTHRSHSHAKYRALWTGALYLRICDCTDQQKFIFNKHLVQSWTKMSPLSVQSHW